MANLRILRQLPLNRNSRKLEKLTRGLIRACQVYLPSCVNLSCKDILVPPRIWRRPPADEGAEGAALPFIVGVAGDEAAQSTAEGKEIMQELPLLTLQRFAVVT